VSAWRSCLLALVAIIAAGCSDNEKQPTVEITTRQGATFLVTGAFVNYQKICKPGTYPVSYLRYGYPEGRGFLKCNITHMVDRPGQGMQNEIVDECVVLWPSIDKIEFLEDKISSSDCAPDIDANVSFADHHEERVTLNGTFDQGLLGDNERGNVMVPLDNIKRLKVVSMLDKPSTKKPQDDLPLKLKVTTKSGEVLVLDRLSSYAPRRSSGLYQGRTVDGLVVMISGAEFSIPWNNLRTVEKLDDGQYRARVIYLDGHTESVEIGGAWGPGFHDGYLPDGTTIHVEIGKQGNPSTMSRIDVVRQ